MEKPPAAIAELAREQGLGQLAVAHRPSTPGGGLFAVAVVLLTAGVGLCAEEFYSSGLITLLLAVVAAAIGSLRYGDARRELPVLYCFQRGAVLRAGTSQLHAYPWAEVDIEIRKTATDLVPWGVAEPDMYVRSKDGKLLASIRDPGKRKKLAELTAG